MRRHAARIVEDVKASASLRLPRPTTKPSSQKCRSSCAGNLPKHRSPRPTNGEAVAAGRADPCRFRRCARGLRSQSGEPEDRWRRSCERTDVDRFRTTALHRDAGSVTGPDSRSSRPGRAQAGHRARDRAAAASRGTAAVLGPSSSPRSGVCITRRASATTPLQAGDTEIGGSVPDRPSDEDARQTGDGDARRGRPGEPGPELSRPHNGRPCLARRPRADTPRESN